MTEEKYRDKYGKELRKGFYVQESVGINPHLNENFNSREKSENIFYFTGSFDKENSRPVFTFYSNSGEVTESYNQYFCGLLRALNENEVEVVVEGSDLIDKFLDWISMD
jgi:hypothetical protein